MKQKNKKEIFGMLLGTLGASVIGSLLSGKGFVRTGSRNEKEKGILRAG